ncbi:filamentous hemagglutinin N-terminal domain-containing protein, partial [Dyella monticola]
MRRSYRSRPDGRDVVVCVDSRKHALGRRFAVLSMLATALGMTSLAYASGGPVGGQIVAGSGQIQQNGTTTTIRQTSPTLSLNWQSFNIAPNQTVDFVQPGSDAIAVNRIFSSTPSAIYGHLNANGQVWLINPNGILFGPDAQVNVGGLVASTLDLQDDTLDSSNRLFSGSGKGGIVNRGRLTAANGGYIALLGNRVSNQGTITAQLGTVALAGGSAVTLTFAGNQLVHLQVDQSTLDNLAENRQLIVADGGRVIMTAGAKDALLASVVNNTGVVQAQTVQNHNGTITLVGGMDAGQVNVGGTLDASAPNGGNGGSIETSAANFNLASGAHITAAAPRGQAGTWLVDPTDLSIDSTAAATISSTLNGGTNVTEQTTSSGASGAGVQASGSSDPGNINVNSAISWNNAAATLTLQAYNGINVNAVISGGNEGKVVMQATGTSGGGITIASGASIQGGGGVTLVTATNFVNDAGGTAVSTGTSAPWLIYSTNPASDTTGGLTPNFIQYNATSSTTPVTTGNGLLYSVAPTLTVSGVAGSVSKTYDGSTSAPLTTANLTTSGLINGDKIASATGTYATSNAGSNIAITTPSAISGFDITNAAGITIYGYGLSGLATANIGTILQAQLTASIIGDPTKVYDGTTTATLSSSNYQLTGFVAGQGATVNQPSSVAYAGADAGSQQVSAAFAITNFVANSGTNLSNYILPTSATGAGTITPAPVLLSGLLANSKVYDGTTTDTLNLSNASIYGVISQDSGNVSLVSTGGTGTFASANAGNNIGVTISGFTLGGSKAGDYQLIAPTNLTADITAKALTLTGVTANNKVYDGTTADTLNTGGVTLNGVVGSDDVSLTGTAAGTFSQSDVGSNLAVSASGLSLTGSAAGNYTLVEPTGLTANITPALLTVAFSGSPTKIYDGTDAATLTSGDFTITGFVNGQSAVVSQSPAIYASSNAGSNISVTATLQPSDFTPGSGTSLSNYTFINTVTGLGTIDPAPLVVSIVNNPTKVYDATTAATLGSSNFTLSGLIGGDSITLNAPTGGLYASANAGIEGVSATLTGANYTAGSGTLLSNYVLPTIANGFGTITPAPVGVSINASLNQPVSKVYDGTNTYLLNAESGGTYTQDFTLTGFQNGDSASVNANITGFFASKNVGNNQPFQVTLNASDFTFACGSGSSCAGNYSFPTYVFTTGDITPAPLTVSLIGNLNKVYDGSAIAQLGSSNFQINGFVSGEGATITPTASFNYATANAGNNISINGTLTANNYAADSGTLLSNYTLQTAVSGLGNISQAPLYITGVYATNKVYDTTTNDTLNIGAAGLAGLVATDAGNVTLNTSTSGTFAQVNVGNGIAVTANGFTLSGSAASNYALQPISGLTANITPATLTISGVTAANKVYDGTNSDTLDVGGGLTLNGVLGSDNVGLSTTGAHGTFITTNVGDNLAVAASGFTLSGAQAGNYTLTQPGGLSADITPAQLTAVITGSPTKVYDGTDSATLTASDYTLTGFVSGQGASIPQSATASYTTTNAGTGLGVQSTLVVSDFVANSGTLLSNYILPASAAGNNGVITPYVLNLSGTRIYDASTDAMGGLFGTITGLNGDTFSLSGQGSVSSKNVGTYSGTGSSTGSQPFNLDSLALVAAGKTGSGPDLASNYTLIGGADTLVITPAVLTITGTTVNTKTYDGTTSATLGGTQALQGVLSGDNVTVATDVGNFASPNAGANIAVASNITLGGTDGGNYVLTQPTGLTGTITQAVITLAGTRQYNASTAADANAFGSSGVINTGVDGETLTVTGVGSVSSANVNTYAQTGGTFNLGTLALANGTGQASNFTLGSSNTFAITPYVLNLTGTRTYDTTTTVDSTVFGSSGTLTGVNGETLTLSGSGTVSNKQVGTYTGTGSATGSQGFNLSTLTLTSGTGQATNYTLIGGSDTLTITKAPLTITGTTVDTKTYDGTTNATLGGTQQLQGVLGSDNVTIATDVGSFASPNAGTNISVTSAITLSGSDAGNYALTQPTGLTGTIEQALINLAGTRQYDAGTDANASAFGVNGVISTGVNGQTLTVTGAGSVSSANVNGYTQVGGTFNLGTLALSNGTGSASNYALGTSNTFAITPYVLNLSGTRVYDGVTDANASLFGGGVLTGVAGETVNVSGSGVLSSKNVGTQSFANLGTLSLTSGTGQATNYTLVGGTDQVTVTPYVINLSGSRAYNGTNSANAALFGSSGVLTGVNGETLTLSGSGAVTGTNVGSYTGANFSLNTLALGNDTGSASNYTLIGGVDALTINPAVINLAGTRQYDANIDANASAFGVGGVISTGVNGETLTVTGVGSVSSQNVNGYTQVGGTFNLGTLALSNGTGSASNYTLGTSNTFAITPYVLNLSGTRMYDGLTDANASLFAGGVLTGVNGETVNVSGSGVLSSKNVGTQSFANLGTLALTSDTGLATNYTLVGGTDQVTVTPYVINLSASRAYDSTAAANAALFGTSGVLTGVNGETLGLNGSGTVTGANVGSYTGANFSLNTLTLSSGTGSASNYTLIGGADALTINPAVVNLSGARVYDANTDANASIFGSNGVINTGVNGQTLTLTGLGAVSNKDVGGYTGADFNLGTLGLSDGTGSASNYTLVGGTDNVSITPATLTVVGTLVGTRVYNGTTSASLSGATLSGIFTGDSVTLGNDSIGTFASGNAGGNIPVSTGMTIGGGDAGNYVLQQPGGLTGTITPYVLDLSGTRVYDANTDANATLFGSNGVLTGINGDTLTLSGSGFVSSKNVGSYTGADFNLNNLALTGNGSALAGNYTLAGGTDTLGITPATLTVTGTLVNTKTYDGGTAATLTGATLNGVFGGDDVTLTNDTAGTFASPNAGSNIAVSNNIGITGGDAGN